MNQIVNDDMYKRYIKAILSKKNKISKKGVNTIYSAVNLRCFILAKIRVTLLSDCFAPKPKYWKSVKLLYFFFISITFISILRLKFPKILSIS